MNARSITTAAIGRAVCATLRARWLPFWAALLSAILLLPALGAGFQLDDHFQHFALTTGYGRSALRLFEFYSGDAAAGQRMLDSGWALPWWAPADFRHSLLRYVSVVTMQLDHLLWPQSAALMHAHSLLWLCALVACAAWLYRELLGTTWPAGLATLLYAVDDAHSLPTVYLANRNALIACCLGVLCVWCYARARQHRSRWAGVLSPLFLLLSLCAGELGISTAAYLVAYALFIDRASRPRRLVALLPHGVALLAWALLYKSGGFGAHGSGYYHDPLGDPLAFLSACAQHVPALLLGQWTPIAAEQPMTPALLGVALLLSALLLVLFYPLVRREAVARFFAAGALLSLIPIAATGPMNRLLFFVGLGSMGLLSLGVRGLIEHCREPRRSYPTRLATAGLVALLLGVHLVLAPIQGLTVLRYQARVSDRQLNAIASVPHDQAIANQDLVLLNCPDYAYGAMAIAPVKLAHGARVPRRLRALTASAGAMQITRLDTHTLEATLATGLFSDELSRYFRGQQLPFHVGERVQLPGFAVEILSLAPHGDPDRLRYRFAQPLEHPSLRFLRWYDGQYLPAQLPAIGHTLQLPAARGLFW